MAGITPGPMAGKTVLVTGGTGGIGKATAIGLAAGGVPFLVEEVLAAPGLPGSCRESVRARLPALAGEEGLLLEAAALLGRHFDWRLPGQVTGVAPNWWPGRSSGAWVTCCSPSLPGSSGSGMRSPGTRSWK